MIQVVCPKCMRRHPAPEAVQGKKVRCNDCGHRFVVPHQGAMMSLHESEIPTPPSSPPQPDAPPADLPPLPLPSPPPSEAPHIEVHAEPATAAKSESLAAANVSMDRILQALNQALSARKIGFFLLGGLVILVVVLLLMGAMGLAVLAKSEGMLVLLALLTVITVIGLTGVVTGGVAHMAHREMQGRIVGILDTAVFCGKRFVALFFGWVLLVVALLLASAAFNGIIALIKNGGSIGSMVAAMVFGAQVLGNALLVVISLVAVIVPCTVAVEGIGPLAAISRLLALATRHTGSLLTQLGLTLFFGSVVLSILAWIFVAAVLPTMATNGPGGKLKFEMPDFDGGPQHDNGFPSAVPSHLGGYPSSWEQMIDRSRRGTSGGQDLFGGAAMPTVKGNEGDRIRWFWLVVLSLAVLAFPVVFWICAFTRYYESNVPLAATDVHYGNRRRI